ncbi:hypothetical protein, partial [Marinitoga sp. 1154]|uniref:hypothetical protein n=1 Tax=Marinitoga sp. 1154 TaxID=1643335 RepID=UPI00158605BA
MFLHNIKVLHEEFEENTIELVRMTFDSIYNSLYDFDAKYYKSLDRFIEKIKESGDTDDFEKKLIDYMNTMHYNTNTKIEKINIDSVDDKLKEKISTLENYNYMVEFILKTDRLSKNIYIRINNDFYLLHHSLAVDKIKKTMDNIIELEKKYKFIKEINIYNMYFEELSGNMGSINETDKKYLSEVFNTEKEVLIEKGNKVNLYYLWEYEDENTMFRPVGIVLKFDLGILRNIMLYNIYIFLVGLLIMLYFISKKAHKVSKQISKPFEIMLDNMKKFQKTRYLEFDKIMEKCEIK